MIFPPEIQHFISNYYILGVIPLDKFLHFFVGMVVTIIILSRKYKFRYVWIVLITLESIKEIHDFYVLNSSFAEQINDVIMTFLYPTIIAITRKIRTRIS